MVLRWLMVMLITLSWLSISNHCALGLANAEGHEPKTISAHDCCATDLPATPQPADDSATPCCKDLRAVALTLEKSPVASAAFSVGVPLDFVLLLVAAPRPLPLAGRFLDNGPPQSRSFAEAVLQRSLLAHAPPVLS